MSTKIKPDALPPPETDGADALQQQPQSGTPDGNATAALPGARQPNERDESPDSELTGQAPSDPQRDDIGQAAEDIERGLVDTDRRGTPNDIPDQERSHATRRSIPRP